MHDDTTRVGARFDDVPPPRAPGAPAPLLATRPVASQPAPWPPPQPEALPTPLVDRLDLRPWAMLGIGVLAGAVLVAAALFLFPGGDDPSTATGGEQLAGAALASEADGLGTPDGDPGSASALAGDPTASSTTVPTTESTLTISTPTTAPTTTSTSTTIATTTTVATTAPPTTPAPTEPPTTATPSTTVSTTASTAPPSSETTPTTASTTTSAPTTTAPVGGGTDDGAVQQAILDAVNAERATAGCPAVRLDPLLNSAANGHSEDMAARVYFSHNDPEGRGLGDRINAVGYPARGAGENIAVGQGSVEQVMTGWMNSSGHRANILNCSFNELGVGYAEGARTDRIPGRYWTQVFATRG